MANCEKIEQMLKEYHQLFDIYNSYTDINNIYTVNANAGKSPVEVDEAIIELLTVGKDMYNMTDGEVNIAMGNVLRVWHDYREAGNQSPETATIPSPQELQSAAEHIDIDNVVIDAANQTVYLSDPEMSLDVGAVAKGFVADAIAEELNDKEITGYALNFGGMVTALGEKPDGSLWNTGIQDPRDLGNVTTSVEIKDVSVVTSGSYQRYYMVDGVKYHHIIDPDTLNPKNDFLSVSVITDRCVVGDVLSTALFNLSLEEGKELLLQFDNTGAMWILPDGTLEFAGGFEKNIVK